MAFEGMVHALKSARRVLEPGGLVVDIRSTGGPAAVACETRAGRVEVGRLRGTHHKTRAATVKLNQVVREALFKLRRIEAFRFLHYAPSLKMLRVYLEDEWSDAWIDDATVKRIRGLLGPKAIGTLILDEPARIHVLVKTEAGRIGRAPVREVTR